MPPPTVEPSPTIALADPPLVRVVRYGFWFAWLALCVLIGVQLERLFSTKQAPLWPRVGVMVVVHKDPWNITLVEERPGKPDRRIVPHLKLDHPESTFGTFRLTPMARNDALGRPTTGMVPLRINSIALDNTNLNLPEIAARTPGWSAVRGDDPSSPIETRTGDPILVNFWSMGSLIYLESGEQAGRVLVEYPPSPGSSVMDLEGGKVGPIGYLGAREVLLEFDLPPMDRNAKEPILPSTLRLIPGPGDEITALSTWTTIGTTRVSGRETIRWTPPKRPLVATPLLASVLVAAGVFVLPLVHWYRRTRLSPDAGCVVAIVTWSAGYAGLLMLFFAPGLTDPDTMFRAAQAGRLAHDGPIPPGAWSSWYPPAKALLTMVPGEVLGIHTFLTFLQAWWLYVSIGLLALVAAGRGWAAWLLLACMLMPHMATHASSMLADASTTAGLCTIAAILLWVRRRGAVLTRGQWALCTGAWMVSCVALLTFRANSVTTLAIILPAALWAGWRWSRLRSAGAVAWAMACVAFSSALPAWLGMGPMQVASASLVWEHVGMLKLSKNAELVRTHSIDDLGRYTDATNKSIGVHDWISHDPLIFGPACPLSRELVTDPALRVQERWWALVRDRPDLYFKTKKEIALLLLGVRHYVPITVLSPHDHPLLGYYAMDIRPSAVLAGDSWIRPMEPAKTWDARTLTLWLEARWRWFMPLYLPYVWIGLAVLITIAAILRGAFAPTTLLPLALAASYYGAYFLVTPGLHWRYFMPAFALLLVVIVAGGAAIARSRTKRSEAGWPMEKALLRSRGVPASHTVGDAVRAGPTT